MNLFLEIENIIQNKYLYHHHPASHPERAMILVSCLWVRKVVSVLLKRGNTFGDSRHPWKWSKCVVPTFCSFPTIVTYEGWKRPFKTSGANFPIVQKKKMEGSREVTVLGTWRILGRIIMAQILDLGPHCLQGSGLSLFFFFPFTMIFFLCFTDSFYLLNPFSNLGSIKRGRKGQVCPVQYDFFSPYALLSPPIFSLLYSKQFSVFKRRYTG